MFYGKTRANTAGIRKKIIEQLKRKGLWTGGAVAADRALAVYRGGSQSTTKQSKRKRKDVPKRVSGVYRPKKLKICKSVSHKPRISKKFRTKVEKCLQYNEPFMVKKSMHNIRLAQTVINEFRHQYLDERGRVLTFNNPQELMHDVSLLQKGKADTDNYGTTAGNMNNDITIRQISYTTNWFFKSTSSHVVNIDMFICTAKFHSSENFQALIDNSYVGDYNDLNTNAGGSGSMGPTNLNAHPDQWVELYKSFKVRKVSFKLQPGDYTSKTFSLARNSTFNMSDLQTGGTEHLVRKGGIIVFFRVINDISVSTIDAPLTEGTVQAFPSNNQGGVACRFQRVAHYKPCPIDSTAATTITQNIYRVSEWQQTAEPGTDQQVAYQNPLNVTTFAG